jgi:hypothetical protein
VYTPTRNFESAQKRVLPARMYAYEESIQIIGVQQKSKESIQSVGSSSLGPHKYHNSKQ